MRINLTHILDVLDFLSLFVGAMNCLKCLFNRRLEFVLSISNKDRYLNKILSLKSVGYHIEIEFQKCMLLVLGPTRLFIKTAWKTKNRVKPVAFHS